MRRFSLALVAIGIVTALLAGARGGALASSGSASGGPDIAVLQAGKLFGNSGAFIGAAGTVRGVPAAGFPWAVGLSNVDLDRNGVLTADVRGLVLANSPLVPPQLRGVNPVPAFDAVVSCLTSSGTSVVRRNVRTADAPATPTGEATIRQKLALPSPCVAPVLLITAPGGAVWFASSGG